MNEHYAKCNFDYGSLWEYFSLSMDQKNNLEYIYVFADVWPIKSVYETRSLRALNIKNPEVFSYIYENQSLETNFILSNAQMLSQMNIRYIILLVGTNKCTRKKAGNQEPKISR
ncbi:hypothetical protein RF11_06070 [Thelohanellus kitauei]|uniref:Uncharacterized protein n=1 Tax=Thelohanellus kitauei TaxID=669202 RepID=A0A0C2IYR2_THEKT|nr:hypothetical protein RF11_06070 [Thelohanellus kitauei]